jgi:hypothetical protein
MLTHERHRDDENKPLKRTGYSDMKITVTANFRAARSNVPLLKTAAKAASWALSIFTSEYLAQSKKNSFCIFEVRLSNTFAA